MPFKIYPFEIEQKGGKIHLNYFHLISSFCNGTDIFKYIDFKKSILLKSINWGEQLIPLSVNSYEEYLNFQNNRQRREAVKVEAITFIKDIFDFDMFRNPFNNNIYISRIFKERLVFEKISGVEISPIDTFIINIL